MKELSSILEAWRQPEGVPETAILATVVDVKGSAYRRPGARMLITPDGKRIGSVSGGCLEGDIVRKAWWWTESGEASVRVYDTTADEDAVWELGLGCNGEVRVLLERLYNAETRELFRFLDECERERSAAVVATVIATTERCLVPIGSRLFLTGEQRASGWLMESTLGPTVRASAQEALASRKSRTVMFGDFEVFVEFIAPALPLLIFGAGQDAMPLARVAKELGWHVTIADGRPAYAQRRRFPSADEVLLTEPGDLLKNVPLDSTSAAVIMNHSYAVDRELVRLLLSYPLRYIGVLGPRARTENMLAELGVTELPECFHAPLGLDIGAETPEGISLSIAAEIQAAVAAREGGKLRDRKAPIYQREEHTERAISPLVMAV
jgi:xanthine dehydrogenase accessory factor